MFQFRSTVLFHVKNQVEEREATNKRGQLNLEVRMDHSIELGWPKENAIRNCGGMSLSNAYCLEDASGGQQLRMERRVQQVAAGQRLVVRVHDRVILRVRLVAAVQKKTPKKTTNNSVNPQQNVTQKKRRKSGENLERVLQKPAIPRRHGRNTQQIVGNHFDELRRRKN